VRHDDNDSFVVAPRVTTSDGPGGMAEHERRRGEQGAGGHRRAAHPRRGAIVEVLRVLDVVGEGTPALGDERAHAVDQATHAARLSMVEALRRCARADRLDSI
jgi:hypothetical protein